MAKDPYCEVYIAVFARAELHGRTISRRHLLGPAKNLCKT
jgi:hypothetical protein